MKKSLFVIFIISLFSFTANAWTLASPQGVKLSKSKIKFIIAGNNCVHAGLNTSSVETLAKEATSTYWNKVPTSSIELDSSGVQSAIDISGDDVNTAALKSGADQIVVGCSSNSTAFPSGTTLLAVAGIACDSGGCRGAVLLNDLATTNLASADRASLLATFGHEFGHALGLGHSSSSTALMYYAIGNKNQTALTQDDIDGISYLYPNEKKLGGLAGACGTIDSTSSKGSASRNFLGSMLIGLLFIAAIKFGSSKSL